ncbi:hypothetical protein PIB30_046983 [Stylosanthes scabra]|uniref:PGG domain-containing protein n=1 Tax=Stylosanthes scabra TaxID=79078 RepID=A0ABU6VEV9_9FABA|nr:hypothetical protein [Stylosanthes scabra]
MARSLRVFWERLQNLMPPNDGEWLKEMRGNLAMVATMIASMTFEIDLNPPEEHINNNYYYRGYLWSKSVSFYTSILSCMWLASGAPVGPGFPTLLLSTLMSFSLGLLAVSYSFANLIIVDKPSHDHDNIIPPFVFFIFLAFFAVLASLLLYRFLILRLPNTQQDKYASNVY